MVCVPAKKRKRVVSDVSVGELDKSESEEIESESDSEKKRGKLKK